MSVTVYKLMRATAVLLLLVSLPGFLPAAAHAQHLVRSRSSAPAEEGPPGKSEEVSTDADHAALSKRVRHSRSRVKSRHFVSPVGFAVVALAPQPRLSETFRARLKTNFAEQIMPLRC
jgi:hypothetical protein